MNRSDNKSEGVWMDVGDDGSIVLPSSTLTAADLEKGGRVMVRVIDGTVQLISHMTMAVEIQRMIKNGVDPSRTLKDLPGVDGLIVERRLEFLREEQNLHAQHDAAE